MASPGELVKCVAKVLGISESTVVQHDRNLVAAGKRTTAGRGTSAARMTPLDAARLLIATAASTQAKDSLKALGEFEGLPPDCSSLKNWQTYAKKGRPPVFGFADAVKALGEDHTFVDMLAALIDTAMGGKLVAALNDRRGRFQDLEDQADRIVVRFFSPFPGCSITDFGGGKHANLSYGAGSYQRPDTSTATTIEEANAIRAAVPNLKQERSFTGRTILAVATCLDAHGSASHAE